MQFRTPHDALGFSLDLQRRLMDADWHPAVLSHPSAQPVWVRTHRGFAARNGALFTLAPSSSRVLPTPSASRSSLWAKMTSLQRLRSGFASHPLAAEHSSVSGDEDAYMVRSRASAAMSAGGGQLLLELADGEESAPLEGVGSQLRLVSGPSSAGEQGDEGGTAMHGHALKGRLDDMHSRALSSLVQLSRLHNALPPSRRRTSGATLADADLAQGGAVATLVLSRTATGTGARDTGHGSVAEGEAGELHLQRSPTSETISGRMEGGTGVPLVVSRSHVSQPHLPQMSGSSSVGNPRAGPPGAQPLTAPGPRGAAQYGPRGTHRKRANSTAAVPGGTPQAGLTIMNAMRYASSGLLKPPQPPPGTQAAHASAPQVLTASGVHLETAGSAPLPTVYSATPSGATEAHATGRDRVSVCTTLCSQQPLNDSTEC